MGQKHDIAATGKPLAHLEQRRPDAEPVHVEDRRGPTTRAFRLADVHGAVTVPRADRELFVAHVFSPLNLRGDAGMASGYHRHTSLRRPATNMVAAVRRR